MNEFKKNYCIYNVRLLITVESPNRFEAQVTKVHCLHFLDLVVPKYYGMSLQVNLKKKFILF